MSRQDVRIRPVVPETGPWFTDSGVGGLGDPLLLVNAEDWSTIANGGLNHSGDFQATYEDYLSTRVRQGYTSTYQSWCAFGSTQGTNGGRGATGADSDGTTPFSTTMDPTTTANTTFWGRRDYFISRAAAHGMFVLLSATSPYLEQSSPNTSPQKTWTLAQWQAFGTFLGARYASSPNVMWMIGDDYFDTITTNLTAFVTNLRAAGSTQSLSIQYAQEAGSRFDYHLAGGTKALASLAQYNYGYSYNVSYLVVEGTGNEASPIPYGWFDGMFIDSFPPSGLTDVQLHRRHVWWALSSGSKGFTTGSDAVWPWASTALAQLTSNSYYTTVIPAISSYFRSLTNWHKLKADTSSVFVTAGRGTHKALYSSNLVYGDGASDGTATSNSYVTASITPAGNLAVIYAPGGGTITVDQTKMLSGYTATWVDPKTCAETTATPGSSYNFTAKGNNSDGLNEWLLVLRG